MIAPFVWIYRVWSGCTAQNERPEQSRLGFEEGGGCVLQLVLVSFFLRPILPKSSEPSKQKASWMGLDFQKRRQSQFPSYPYWQEEARRIVEEHYGGPA